MDALNEAYEEFYGDDEEFYGGDEDYMEFDVDGDDRLEFDDDDEEPVGAIPAAAPTRPFDAFMHFDHAAWAAFAAADPAGFVHFAHGDPAASVAYGDPAAFAAADPAAFAVGVLAAASALPAGLDAAAFATVYPAAFAAGVIAAAALHFSVADLAAANLAAAADLAPMEEMDLKDCWTAVTASRFTRVRGLQEPQDFHDEENVKLSAEFPWYKKTGSLDVVRKHSQARKASFVSTIEGSGHYVYGSYGPDSLEY